jgi:hypothetical protein
MRVVQHFCQVARLMRLQNSHNLAASYCVGIPTRWKVPLCGDSRRFRRSRELSCGDFRRGTATSPVVWDTRRGEPPESHTMEPTNWANVLAPHTMSARPSRQSHTMEPTRPQAREAPHNGKGDLRKRRRAPHDSHRSSAKGPTRWARGKLRDFCGTFLPPCATCAALLPGCATFAAAKLE